MRLDSQAAGGSVSRFSRSAVVRARGNLGFRGSGFRV